MNSIITFCLLVFVSCVYFTESAPSNCGIGEACDGCQHHKVLQFNDGTNITVCCKSCSKYFTAGFFDEANKSGPYCACQFDRVSGTCWKGDQCASCDPGNVGSINGLPVCCPNCEPRGLNISPTSCHCNNE